ncbi:MAG TPA: hypothetical protein VIW93_14235 [Candidatus Acidoferrum sp.]
MGTNPKEPDRRKFRWLIMGFVCYFLFMVYALPRATLLPPRIFALCGILNFALIGAFVFDIKRVYLRMKGLTLPEGVEVDETTAKLRMDFDRRRLKWLWIGAGLYSLIFLNGIRFGFTNVSSLPLVVIVFAETVNGTILTVIVLEIRKVHRRLESGQPRQS